MRSRDPVVAVGYPGGPNTYQKLASSRCQRARLPHNRGRPCQCRRWRRRPQRQSAHGVPQLRRRRNNRRTHQSRRLDARWSRPIRNPPGVAHITTATAPTKPLVSARIDRSLSPETRAIIAGQNAPIRAGVPARSVRWRFVGAAQQSSVSSARTLSSPLLCRGQATGSAGVVWAQRPKTSNETSNGRLETG